MKNILTIISIMLFTFLHSQTKLYVHPDGKKYAANTKTLAILPLDVQVKMRPKQLKEFTSDQIKEMEKAEALDIQKGMHTWFLTRKKRGESKLNVQPPVRTNALLKKAGIERRVYTSGKSKSFLDPFKEEKEEDINRLKKIQEQIHENFISYVKSRRGNKIKEEDYDEVFSGLFWVGHKAIELGLGDGIGSINDVLRQKFGKKVKIKLIDQKKSFIQRKLSSSLIDSETILQKIEEKAMWSRFGL